MAFFEKDIYTHSMADRWEIYSVRGFDYGRTFEFLARERNITVEEMRPVISVCIEKGWNDPEKRAQWRLDKKQLLRFWHIASI